MTYDRERAPGRSSASIDAGPDLRSPGKSTRVQLLQAPGAPGQGDALALAAQGTAGAGSALPYLDQIQAAFGRHDVRGVSAHTGAEATGAASAMGAQAYATGNRVAFGGGGPSLHTAAHEAAHVVQQRAGVQLQGGVGQSGDRYEQHADAVADAVVAGKPAEGLLDQMAGGGGGAAVQREDKPGAGDASADPDKAVLDAGEAALAAGKTTFHWTPDKSTDGRPRALAFDDAAVEAMFDHLINKWDGSPELRLEVGDANSGVPLFLAKFRQHALVVRAAPLGPSAKAVAKMPAESPLEIHQAQAARTLCDAVAPQSGAEKFRADIVKQADKTVGQVVVSTDTIAETRHPTKPNAKGVVPKGVPSYTSCIDTAGAEFARTKVDKDATHPVLPGIGTMEFESSPAFIKYTAGSTARPRIGDFAIYAKQAGGKANFQHVDIIRKMDPPGQDGLETWYTVDGGQESTAVDKAVPTAEGTGQFNPATGAYGKDGRVLYGWLDVEKLYADAQKPKQP